MKTLTAGELRNAVGGVMIIMDDDLNIIFPSIPSTEPRDSPFNIYTTIVDIVRLMPY
ncbi:Uncharacterised protein [Neisseria canis]|uniref:Uncharacterized protein n=2 Tax=Neisseria canis TaxID=493 RepID=A0A448D515_9NEIS|nr:Uncharacterised protein [Neisseria canis]